MEGTKHVDYLDGWRGLAILLVLLFHFELVPTIAGHGLNTGGLGVECFFVLSGRLMAEILFKRQMPIGQFYWRRTSRILPALIVFLSVLYLLRLATSTDIVKVLTTSAGYLEVSGPLAHMWSICVEEHAYFLLSIIALFSRRFDFSVSTVLFTITTLCMANGLIQTYAFHRDVFHVYWHSDVRIASVFISAGFFLSGIRFSRWVPSAAMLMGFAIDMIHSVPDAVKYTFGTTLLAIAVNSIGFSQVARTLSRPIMRHLGLWSFSLYLWQQPFYLVGGRLWVPVVFAIAIASYFLIEQPSRKALNRLYETRKVGLRDEITGRSIGAKWRG